VSREKTNSGKRKKHFTWQVAASAVALLNQSNQNFTAFYWLMIRKRLCKSGGEAVSDLSKLYCVVSSTLYPNFLAANSKQVISPDPKIGSKD
jgi:hypothetical protein